MAAETEAVAPAATSAAPVATTAEQASTEPQSAEALAAKLELVKQDSLRKGEANVRKDAEIAELKKQMAEVQRHQENERAQRLKESGDSQAFLNEIERLKAENQKLCEQLESERDARTTERIESLALDRIRQHGAFDAKDVLQLVRPSLRESSGQLLVSDNGTDKTLDAYLQEQRSPNSPRNYLFESQAPGGMGTTQAAPSNIAGVENPWISGNITQQLRMLAENQDLARSMQAQAQAGQAAR